MVDPLYKAFEAGLKEIAEGLAKPRGQTLHDKIVERIGKLEAKSRGASQHDQITLTTDEQGKTVTALSWAYKPMAGTMATHPGVYCLRSNELSWDEEKLWRTYTMLTDLESVSFAASRARQQLGVCVRFSTPRTTAAMGTCSSPCWPTSACRCCA